MAFTKTGKTVTIATTDKPVQKPEIKPVDKDKDIENKDNGK